MTDRPSLTDLAAENFTQRHIATDADQQRHMLEIVGFSSAEDLVNTAIPAAIHTSLDTQLPPALSQAEVLSQLQLLAHNNQVLTSMIGLGYYHTHTPPVIRRNVLENPAWYTAYTPYQPEISQGRLEALVNFQTMIADLTGLPIAGASLLDEATAAAEAMALARRMSTVPPEAIFVVDADVFPQTLAVIGTRAQPLGIKVVVADLRHGLPDGAIFAVLVQYPGSSGRIDDHTELIKQAHQRGALVAVAADLLALTLLRPPGQIGADIAVGTTQRFGIPMGFGGPHAGYIAVDSTARRHLPGRLVGVSRDAHGKTAYRLALQTREQHIRREKATSNICTAQVLPAVMAGLYAVWHGPQGLKQIAYRTHRYAAVLAGGLRDLGVDLGSQHFFDTVVAHVPQQAAAVVAAACKRGINVRLIDSDQLSIACDETTTAGHLEQVWAAFAEVLGINNQRPEVMALDIATHDALPSAQQRSSTFLTHPVFHQNHSETAMLRYLRRLADADYALDRGAIPLGSCTMKLNATAEMEAITLPGFADMHPFAPPAQTGGYRRLITDVQTWLATITGYDAISVQPNAGSQGELAGLLAIRAYLHDQGQTQRDVCLIPASAHGTNAASAVMAGMRVVVVACDEAGNVDLADLDSTINIHRNQLAAMMITYPSTHGVYEQHIDKMCAAVHQAGGQVYVDGANLNALVGFAQPGKFGADVSHLNLHKTFCIPHGGGGPGVGPIGVRAHLSPYLPSHPFATTETHEATVVGPVAAAPYGSAGILPIAWAYIRLLGTKGLQQATASAVLAANYVAVRLKEHYPILYTGPGGLVAHECVIDVRPLTKHSGVTVEDIAKRLMDYGFHAPTVSFPVAGTLMIEPTESEPLVEVERFITAMIAIRAEIEQVIAGHWPVSESPLRNAPHTAQMLVGDWHYPYDRHVAVYPMAMLEQHKYWPPVARIDNAYGDRNLMCVCPPMEAFKE